MISSFTDFSLIVRDSGCKVEILSIDNSAIHWIFWVAAVLFLWVAIPFMLAYVFLCKRYNVKVTNRIGVVIYVGYISKDVYQTCKLSGLTNTYESE